jgi:hypothetical protein
MAAPIRNMFREVQYELVKIVLLNVFLSTVIFFLAADLIALIFGMPLLYVLILSGIYFIIVLVLELRKISVSRVEKSNPELREILRTAKDNQSEDSLMAHALFFEVLEKMKRVSSGTFLDFRQLMTKIAAVFVLSIILVSLAFFNINIQRFDNPFERPIAAAGAFFGKILGQEPDASGVGGANDDIFGDASMAKLGDDQLTATVNPSLSTPDFSTVDPTTPSSDPLADLGGSGDAFNAPGSTFDSGLSQRDQERSYKYAKETQTT